MPSWNSSKVSLKYGRVCKELVDFLLGLGVLELLADAVFCQGVEQDVGDGRWRAALC